jgi:DNA-binding response OmpR family regulator
MNTPAIHVLLAEDDENLGTLLCEYLKAKSFEVDLFVNGDLAFKGFKRSQYDICVLDVMMPVKDGFTVAREIREINPKMPILFLTAKAQKEDILEGFSLGADDYIPKPFNMEELVFRIEAILRRTRTNQTTEQN